ncbi:MAG: hypothetical protein RLZ14_1976 [Actinomycetota bacterium]
MQLSTHDVDVYTKARLAPDYYPFDSGLLCSRPAKVPNPDNDTRSRICVSKGQESQVSFANGMPVSQHASVESFVQSAVDALVAAQWSNAAEHEVLAPALEGMAGLGPLGAMLAMFDDTGEIARSAACAAEPQLESVFAAFHPSQFDFIGAAATSGEPVWLHTTDAKQMTLALDPQPIGVGSWAAVPLQAGQATIGVLATAFANPLPFDEGQRSIVMALSRLAALALASDLVTVPGVDTAVPAVARERERLARDLHDGVVQDVIATAMGLASLVPLVSDVVRPRLERIIENQDLIVRELRRTIFSLRPIDEPDDTPSRDLLGVAVEAEKLLGFRPTLHLNGDVDEIDRVMLGHLELSMHEMLANVARHAAAGHVDVTVSVDDRVVTLSVVDDGLGMATHAGRGNGLDNLAHRAQQLGGRCDFSSGSRGGTMVRWSVPRTPLPQPDGDVEKDPT